LSTVATEKNKMAGELEVLRSQERRLKEKVANMEVALDKVLLTKYRRQLSSSSY
jgi:predicted  nucleic acid-binding Zn-ribbon protein